MSRRGEIRGSASEHALAFGLVAGAVLVAFSAVIGPERGLLGTEHLQYFRPRWFHAVEAVREGRLPVLTTASAVGLPFEQHRSAFYTPGTLLFLLGPFDLVYDLHVVFCFLLLAAGAYLLAARLGARPLAAASGAAVAALSGPAVAQQDFLPALIALAWAPWVWLAIDRALTRGDARAAGLLALALGFHLQGATAVLGWLDLAALVLLVAHRGFPGPRRMLALAGGLTIGAAIAAIGVMPAIEAAREARFTTAPPEGFEPTRLVELFAPAMWLPDDPGSAPGRRWSTIYLGTALLFLALARRDRTSLALLALFAAGIGLSLATPSQSWLLLSTAALAALAASCLGALGQKPERAAASLLAQVFVLATTASVILSPEFEHWLGLSVFDARSDQRMGALGIADVPAGFFHPPEHPRGRLIAAMSERLLHGGLFTAAALVVCFSMAYRPARRATLSRVVPLLVVLDLALAAHRAVVGIELERVRPPPDVAAALRGPYQRVFALPDRRFADAEPVPLERALIEARARDDGVRGFAASFDVRRLHTSSLYDVSPDPWARRLAQVIARTPGERQSALLARSGAAWLATWLTSVRQELAMVYDVAGESPASVYHLAGARPWVKAYARWIRMNPFLLADEQLRAAFSDPALADIALIPDTTTPVEIELPRPAPRCDPAPIAVLAPGASEGDLTVDVSAGCEVLVVALEHTMAGWRAELDGVAVPVHDVEAGFLGAWAPAGTHRLRFHYAAFTRSWVELSLGALAIALLLVAVPPRKSALRPGVSTP